ncbi:MAG: hypothetical protein KGH75_09900 [Rhodospirillales bacterium]|nr:hypothetical protein [Rhodospirillales bacterium]
MMQKIKKTIYFAGGMQNGWQEYFAQLQQKYECLDPRSWSSPDPAIYTAKDIDGVTKSDLVLVYMDSKNPSGYGLSVELGLAYGLNKIIVFVDQIKNDWRSKYYGMHREMATVVVNSVKEAIDFIETNL